MAVVDPSSLPENSKPSRWKLWLFLILVVLPVAAFSAYTWITLHFVYAKGERTGFVQKLSRKGWIFKTWEGELAMVNLPGAMPEIFEFSVRHDDVAEDILQHRGQRVALQYDEHRGIPVSWFAETRYFVTGLTPVADPFANPPK
jgi:hypothetical protein